ncbi:MAG: (2Fe-2S) ferredoxin domain-containing protein [Acidobacteriota bacterium]
MAGFEKHVFTCINQRGPDAPRGCCHSKGGTEVAAALKMALAERGLKKRIRSNQAGCLDHCEHGVTVVVYPDAVWYGGVTPADVEEIVESHLVGGTPVERLVIRDEPDAESET